METLSTLFPKPETLAVGRQHQRLFIGIPRETTLQENRVALTPHSVHTLANHGHRIVIESGAGEKAHYSDLAYAEAGAEVVHVAKEVYEADVIIKVAPPDPRRNRIDPTQSGAHFAHSSAHDAH